MDNNTFFEVDYSYQTELYKLYNQGSNEFKFLKEEVAKNIFFYFERCSRKEIFKRYKFWELGMG